MKSIQISNQFDCKINSSAIRTPPPPHTQLKVYNWSLLLLNNHKVSWLKSEWKELGQIEKSRWCSGGAVVLEAWRARIDSRLGRELFYVGFRVEETD